MTTAASIERAGDECRCTAVSDVPRGAGVRSGELAWGVAHCEPSWTRSEYTDLRRRRVLPAFIFRSLLARPVHLVLSVSMSRPLRIEFPGAFYHVTARGNERKAIYRNDRDRQRFLSTLADIVYRFQLRAHAYVLMDNHLLVETPEGNLQRAMRALNATYQSSTSTRTATAVRTLVIPAARVRRQIRRLRRRHNEARSRAAQCFSTLDGRYLQSRDACQCGLAPIEGEERCCREHQGAGDVQNVEAARPKLLRAHGAEALGFGHDV